MLNFIILVLLHFVLAAPLGPVGMLAFREIWLRKSCRAVMPIAFAAVIGEFIIVSITLGLVIISDIFYEKISHFLPLANNLPFILKMLGAFIAFAAGLYFFLSKPEITKSKITRKRAWALFCACVVLVAFHPNHFVWYWGAYSLFGINYENPGLFLLFLSVFLGTALSWGIIVIYPSLYLSNRVKDDKKRLRWIEAMSKLGGTILMLLALYLVISNVKNLL